MAIKSLNFDYDPVNPTANLYTAADWREMQMAIVSNGIVLNADANLATDTSCKVAAITGGVNIANGKVAIQGGEGIITNTIAENVLISVDGTYRILLEFNSVLGKIYSKSITVATALTRTATVWQIQLATVVKSGTTYTVTDTRQDDAVCGYANRLAVSPQAALQAQLNTGWIPSNVVLTYASADSPTFVVNTASNLTDLIGVGNRIKLTQTTVKYFIVTAITATTITLYGGTDYTLTNATISNFNFSNVKAPLGFSLNPDKWTLTTTITTDVVVTTNPVIETWYTTSGYLTVAIGLWKLFHAETVKVTTDAVNVSNYASIYTTLSLTATTETDAETTDFAWVNNVGASAFSLSGEVIKAFTSKTTVALLAKADDATAGSITLLGANRKAYIKAVSAYL